MTQLVLPDLEGVREVFAAFDRTGIVAALGGSAVLAALGLVDVVHDWDITTDADVDAVRAALDAAGIAYVEAPKPDASYAARAYIQVVDAPIEISVGYAIGTPDGDVAIPTVIGRTWLGLPLSDPAPWVIAYRAMGRSDRSQALQAAVDDERGGARP